MNLPLTPSRARVRAAADHAAPLPGAPLPPRSCLDRGARSTMTDTELTAMRAAAWHRHGVAALAIHDIADPWLRQAVINEATRRWGPRNRGQNHGR